MVSPATRAWLEWVLVTSIPLRRYDERDTLLSRASGALIEHSNRRFLLSVAHAVPRGTSRWAMELGHDPSKGTEVFWLNSFAYLGEYRRSTGVLRELDFCLAEVPANLSSFYEHRTPRGLFDKRPHHVFRPDLALPSDPDPQGIFAFSGQVKTEQHAPNTFASEMIVYPGLRYLRNDHEMHVFQLPVSHPGHEAFRGCSGSPIVDMNHRAVAMVVDGDIASNTIRGISLHRCKPIVDLLCARGRDA